MITQHFNTKIEAFSNSQNNPLTENQVEFIDNLIKLKSFSVQFSKVLDIIRNNYDTLALKLHDDLDQYDNYSEKACEASFFANIVSINKTFEYFTMKLILFSKTRNIIGNYRRQYSLDTNSSVQLSNILLKEVPTIS